jgi:GTPase Era involved in 16S rRNA processing
MIVDYTPKERLEMIAEILAEGVLSLLSNSIPFFSLVNIKDRVRVEDIVFVRVYDPFVPNPPILH